MTSIADVAAAAGVGVGTVSRVLNDSPHVSPDTRARVRQAIEELDYQPSATARALSSGRSSAICVVVPPVTSPGMKERLGAAIEVLSRRDLSVVVAVAPNPEVLDGIVGTYSSVDRAAGLLLLEVSVSPEAAAGLTTTGVPAAVTGSLVTGVPSIWVDGMQAVQMATDHLLELGHRRIALVQQAEAPSAGEELPRRQGYLAALRGVSGKPRIETIPDLRDPGTRGRIGQLLADPGAVTGVVTASDELAYEVLAVAEVAGRSVPRDLSVVGCGDLASSEYLGLTTVREQIPESAAWAAEQVLSSIDAINSEPAQRAVTLQLVLRKTTGIPGPVPVA